MDSSPPSSLQHASQASLDFGSGSDKENAIRPGRLSSPLKETKKHGTHDASSVSSSSGSDGDSDDGNAYERVRRRLLGAGKESVPVPKPVRRATPEEEDGGGESASENDGLPVSAPAPAARGRMARRMLGQDDAPSDDDPAAQPRSRLEELVARRREERLAAEREAAAFASEEEEEESLEKNKTPNVSSSQLEAQIAHDQDDDRDQAASKFTAEARPARKASKRALEEMNRETQRMNRNMQLAHQAKTKIKFSTADLFKKFNFRQGGGVQLQPQPGSSSAVGSSDHEKDAHTPPSSPPSLGSGERGEKEAVAQELPADEDSGDDLMAALKGARQDTQRATVAPLQSAGARPAHEEKQPRPRISVRKFMKSAKRSANSVLEEDDDDDLDIVAPTTSLLGRNKEPSRIAALNRPPKERIAEASSLHALRALANLHEHEDVRKPGVKKSVPVSELKDMLRRKAREQALKERDEKIAALRAKGVYIQTTEEREKDQMQVEDMLARARQEAAEIAAREKEAAKREGRVEGQLPDSEDDEDEDYIASDEEELQLSGSEDEGEEGDDEEEEEEEEEEQQHPLFDEEAEGDEAEGEEVVVEEDDAEPIADERQPALAPPRRKRIIDSDDDEEGPTLAHATPQRTARPTVTPKSAVAAAFGFQQNQAAGLGLSQMFAGTMAESQDDSQDVGPVDSQQDSLAFLRGGMPAAPPPTFGAVSRVSSSADNGNDNQVTQVMATQEEGTPAGVLHFETQTQLPAYEESLGTGSPAFEATQDQGFANIMSPLAGRVAGPAGSFSTVATMPLARQSATQSPLKRRGRLQRAREQKSPSPVQAPAGDSEAVGGWQDEEPVGDDDFEISADAFNVMKKAAKSKKQAKEAFDKKNSNARDMFEEQAEESEDEYAGLGGLSDDESGGEGDAETQKMIDDLSKEKLNERQVAALFAENERADNEKGVEQLYKDIMNGGLRRKRGGQELDLWDSDDDDEVARRRRAAKQREFAKMRKALLADENIGKIAENPKQAAFLAAIEDRMEEDDSFALDDPSPTVEGEETLSQEQAPHVPDSQEGGASALKRKSSFDSGPRRSAPALRRSGGITKPTSLAHIRDTLSDLLGEPQSIHDSQPDARLSPDEEQRDPLDEYEEDDFIVRDSPEPEAALLVESATTAGPSRPRVIDRKASRRASKAVPKNQTRLAFTSLSTGANAGFKVPSLLKRATTNASESSTSSAGGLGAQVVKMGGSKKSSVNFYTRQKERQSRVLEVETKREEGLDRARGGMRGLDGVRGGVFG